MDIIPRYEKKILEETDEYQIYITGWGVTRKSFKTQDSTPEFLDFQVTAPETWEDAKRRMAILDDERPLGVSEKEL